MQAGDLVSYNGAIWYIRSYDLRMQVGHAVNTTGECEIFNDAKDLVHIAHPATDWPVIMAPIKTGAGPFLLLSIPALPGQGGDRVLEPFEFWMQSDPTRHGGSIFLNPSLNLRPGTVLLAQHRSSHRVRITVPPAFGTITQRRNRLPQKDLKPAEPATRFSRLKDED